MIMTRFTQKTIAINIEIASELSKEEFDERYFKTALPVLIKGGCDEWPARQWTSENLKERVGGNAVYVRTNTQSREYQIGTKYNVKQSTFGKYISDLQADNKQSKDSYLAVQNIKKAFPQLNNDVYIPRYVEKVHGGPYLWVARRGHYEYCHTDADDGMLCVLSGSKKCRLYGGEMGPMYVNSLGTKGRTLQSRVDCDDPNFEEHPEFLNATCHECLVLPGDILYIPAFWWHQITSPELTISVNIFWGNNGTNNYITKCMAEPIRPIFEHWILNIIEQNRYHKSFQRNLERIHDSLSHFILNQWHETATTQQIDYIVKLVKTYLNIEVFPSAPLKPSKFPPPLNIRGLLWRN